jgi:hypothetical protein
MASAGHEMRPSADAAVATDLVAYLVLELPDRQVLTSLAEPLRALVARRVIRILDVVVVERDSDGVVGALELDDLEGLEPLRDVCQRVGIELSERDIRLATLPVRPGAVGLVVLTEDRWASALSSAAHVAGGRIVAGERIPAVRVDRARRGDDERREA